MAAKQSPGRESLVYQRSKVSWATAEYLDKPPAAATRAFLYGVCALFFVALVYSGFSEVAISVTARGTLVTREAMVPVNAPLAFSVGRVFVKENEAVEAGAVLLESEHRLTDEEYNVVRSQKEWLSKLLEKHKTGACPECASQLRQFSAGAFKLENKGAIRGVLTGVRQLLLDFVAQIDGEQKLDSTNTALRRRIQIAEEKLAEIRRRKAEQILAIQVEELTSEIVSARAQLAERRQGVQRSLVQSRNELEIALGDLIEKVEQYRAQNRLLAPSAGVVTDLAVAPGQLAAPGQQLLRIVPLDSGLEARLWIANQDISKVAKGMKVQVKLDALPEREYGVATGVVESISADVTSSGVAGPAVYEVGVRLDSQSLAKGGVEHPFRLGMTLTGVVVTRHESLLVVGMRKVFNLKDDLFEE